MDAANSTTLHQEFAAESLVEQNTINIKLIQTGTEGSGFRLNDLPGGEIQRSRVKQVEDSGLILQVNLLNVLHGTCTPGGPRATLAVFEFRFLGSKSHGRRFRYADITIHFAFGRKPGDILDPVVVAIIPDGEFVLRRSVSKITETRSGSFNASIPFNVSSPSASLAYARAQEAEKETRQTIFGTSRLEGRRSGQPNSVKWVLDEDKQGGHGIPAMFATAVLLEPQTADNFRAFVHVDTEVDVVYNTRTLFKEFFGVADDPLTFNQDQKPMGSHLGLDTQNLSAAFHSLQWRSLISSSNLNEL